MAARHLHLTGLLVACLAVLTACGGDGDSRHDGASSGGAAGAGAAPMGGAVNTGTTSAGGGSAPEGGAGGSAPEGGADGVDVHLQPQDHSSQLLFDPATDELNVSYHSFRIPSIIRTNAGTLIAFAEGRVCTASDYGNINLVYKRSFDHGVSWGPLQEVVGAGQGTWGNPTAVVDADTGTIWLFLSWNAEDKSEKGDPNPCDGSPTSAVGPGDRPVKMTASTDDGGHWTTPVDLTTDTQPPGMAWDAVGPGVGIQVTVGTSPGRLVVPATGRNIYSDDQGASWTFAPVPDGTGEATIVELSTGELLRNDRAVKNVWDTAKRRWLSRGTIAGGFEDFFPHGDLLDPRVEGASLRYSVHPHRLVFLNPASTVGRCKMRVRLSYDDGVTWPLSRQLRDEAPTDAQCELDPDGYSSLARTADSHIGALAERAQGGGHRGIEFHRFNLSWIVDGTAEPL
jgi:sialidase-1